MHPLRTALTAMVALVVAAFSTEAQASTFSCDSDMSRKSVINLLAKHHGKDPVYQFDPVTNQSAPYLLETVKKGSSVKSAIQFYFNAHLALAADKLEASLSVTGGQQQGIEVYVCPYKVKGDLAKARVEDIQELKRSTSDGSESKKATATAKGANVFMIFLRPKTSTARTQYTLSAS
jgi:hypothetical protein